MSVTTIIVTTSNFSKLTKIIKQVSKQVDEVLIIKLNKKLKENVIERKKISPKVQLIETNQNEASKRRNLGIRLATSSLIAFIDDDCLVEEHWAASAAKAFKEKDCDLLLGTILPFDGSKKKGFFCPSTIQINKSRFVRKIEKPWQIPGLGNNIWFKKTFLEKIGGYKEWLGLGSICYNGEDLEIILRSIIKCKNVYLISDCVVYHDKWISAEQQFHLNRSYCYGNISAYTYIAFSYKYPHLLKEAYGEFKFLIAEDLKKKSRIFLVLLDTLRALKCFLTATFFALKDIKLNSI